eukprot:TRINITY_DN5671_c0_g1_i1.p1 TRINITY_DN5671_c0_g1~~TRINITY_DN5671_c0_g1_i1.p1  ORF type:complete len:235 (+),score=45.22 TRINITY_DN5671_c0_g1_i1:30-707(+)
MSSSMFYTQKRTFFLYHIFKKYGTTDAHYRIKRDLKRGNFWEINQVKHYKGKPYPATLLKKPVPFPAFEVIENGEKKPITDILKRSEMTLVLVSQKRVLLHDHMMSWRRPVKAEVPEAPIVELIIPSNHLYRMLHPMMWMTMKKDYDEEDMKKVFVVKPTCPSFLWPEKLGIDIENSFFAFAFLVDKNNKVVWKGSGIAARTEIPPLLNYCKQLLSKGTKQMTAN